MSFKDISEIVNFLNEKTGKRFKSNAVATNKLIESRFKEGYTVDDFKKVIIVKVEDWIGTNNEKYLSPATLFKQPNFEKYYNQKSKEEMDNISVNKNTPIDDLYMKVVDVLKKLPYEEYLESNHWKFFKSEYYKSHEKKCAICGSREDVQLHHNNYENRGRETFNDVVCLCKECHKKHHGIE